MSNQISAMGPLVEKYRDFFPYCVLPWLDNASDAYYETALEAMDHEKHNHEPDYRVAFCKPVAEKRKWYLRYIDNNAIRFLNQLGHDVEQAMGEKEKKGIVRGVLKEVVARGIMHMVDEANVRGYKQKHYELNGMCSGRSIRHATSSYIVYYTIYRLVCIYMEVQQQHAQHVSGAVLTLDEVFQVHCNHLSRDYVVRVVPEAAPLAEKLVFIPCKHDLRPPPNGVLTFDEIIKNPEKFAWFEQELFASNLIDHQHTFQNKRGAQTTLAMIIAHLYRLGYFNDKVIPGLRPIRLIDVIHFAEHRYQARLYRLVRNAVADPRGLDRFVKMHRWLELLPGRK